MRAPLLLCALALAGCNSAPTTPDPPPKGLEVVMDYDDTIVSRTCDGDTAVYLTTSQSSREAGSVAVDDNAEVCRTSATTETRENISAQ